MVRIKVADFSSIRDWIVKNHNAEHLQDLKWLRQQIQDIALEDYKGRPSVVIMYDSTTPMRL